MRKNLTYKILAAVMAVSTVNVFMPHNMLAYGITSDNTTISTGTINENIYGNGHSFTINGDAVINGNVYGVGKNGHTGIAIGGNVTISGGSISGDVYGGQSNDGSANNNTVNIKDDVIISNNSHNSVAIHGGQSNDGSANNNTVNISGGTISSLGFPSDVYGGYASGEAYNNTVNISGDNSSVTRVYGGYSYSDGSAHHNTVNISGDAKVTGEVHGGDSTSDKAYNNTVNISGGIIGEANDIVNIYGGYSDGGNAYDNEIIISGSADIENANLYGSNKSNSNNTGNTLTIDGWRGSTNSVQNFNDIAFKNINWQNDGTVLTITRGNANALDNTNIKTINIAGGSNINVGESMTLIDSNIDLTNEVISETNKNFTAGVAREGLGSTSIKNGNVTFKVNSIKLSSQAVGAAQTRAASAAFVNQGTDLISDSLDTISRDDNYGVKTFAAVHGNRSKYDVADDIKINGWSTIVGVGNADKFDNGSEFSWGVFYENGSGNYRTYNSFNNEFFRGDGSMVYNGGGIAARYENKNGVYTEGSLRAGMLKNELDNAMRDVNGSYGYETESAYYGAHIGVGKIISLSDSSDLDIYGKFFHTYTEGDSVTIADDEFDFDSITSERLRVGARITSNKENKFSTYYGLAYEYEFNGDADMTAQGLKAPTQSLQGSSVMAEVGFNYQPTPGSPWSFDLNMRGYTGERQGGSFNVQATYTF